MTSLKVGDTAPSFVLSGTKGNFNLEDYQDKNVVLYFYPKDNTPGCTLQARGFQAKLHEFDELNTIIVGVSKDNLESHEKFCEKYELNFNLLADIDGEVCKLYDVWQQKSFLGKKYFGIERTTFLIQNKKITFIWPKVKIVGHINEIIHTIKVNN